MLTPMTRLARPSVLLRTRIARPMVAVRAYAGKDIGPNKTHTADKGADDVQSESSTKAQNEHAEGTGNSQATSRRDEGNFNEKAKKDYPEAPDTVIGMNDERGGKGH